MIGKGIRHNPFPSPLLSLAKKDKTQFGNVKDIVFLYYYKINKLLNLPLKLNYSMFYYHHFQILIKDLIYTSV